MSGYLGSRELGLVAADDGGAWIPVGPGKDCPTRTLEPRKRAG
jgi:hypothetical protein